MHTWGWIDKALQHVQRVTTDGESVIAPEVPELIKKQDHTPVQSSERGEGRSEGREGGEEGRMQSLDGDFSPECHWDLMNLHRWKKKKKETL